MQATIEHLLKIVSNYSAKLEGIPEEVYADKPHPERWSKREILGHLVDSAQNNIRRFVVAQYEEIPTIGYDQDKWVSIGHYQHYPTRDLIALWNLLNRHICQVLASTPAGAAERKCTSPGGQPQTINWLAADYCNHLLHHLHHLLELEPIAYP